MSQKFVSSLQPQTFPMSSAHPHTLNIGADDEEDNDICPVCDGECTCSTNLSPKKPSPVLKIRLPAVRVQPPHPQHPSTSASVHSSNAAKRRGRPPKYLTAAKPYKSQPARRKPYPPAPKHATKSYNPLPPKSKSIPKRKRPTIIESSDDELSDGDVGADLRSIPHFPTFVPASAVNSSADSSSDDSDSDGLDGLGGFETDSSIEAEEENYILAEERARIRQELLGPNDNSNTNNPPNKRRDSWIIRPRKTSVGDPSDVDMDDDSSADDEDSDSDDEDEDETEDADIEEDGAESDGQASGQDQHMATGWSDDEGDSLDADLFFANLSGSSSSSSSDDEGDAGQTQPFDAEALGEALLRLPRTEDIPFEVTEGWDGQIMFTSGLNDGHHATLDDFDARAMKFIVESSASASEGADGDVDMDDWEEDDDVLDGGDTTDEDLVGPDDLPNEKAMQMFNLTFATSQLSVDPSISARRSLIVGRAPSEEMDVPGEVLSPRSTGPTQGQFDMAQMGDKRKTAIVSEDRTNVLPSPHPRRRRARIFDDAQRPLFLLPRPSSPSPTSTTRSASEHGLLGGAINLDDVLDSSFLDGSSSDHSAPTPTGRDHFRHLSRWDNMSVNAFRRKDVDGPSESEYSGVIKSSPLAAMLWQNKLGFTETEAAAKQSRRDERRERRLLKKSMGTHQPPFLGKGKGKSAHQHIPRIWHHAHHANGKMGRAGSAQRFASRGNSPIH